MRLAFCAILALAAATLWPIPHVGDYAADETVPYCWHTYDSNGALVTATALVAADVEIYKAAGTTQRASDNGITVSVDFDTTTGLHCVTIDTSDNSDAGFYTAAPTYYQVHIGPYTVDGQSVGNGFLFSMGAYATTSATADAVWDESTSGHTTGGTFGAQVATDVDAILVDTNSLNDTKVPDTLSLANINAEVDTSIVDHNLDHVALNAAAGAADVAQDSILGKMAIDGAFSGFAPASGSLVALRTKLDNGITLTAAGVTAVTDDVFAEVIDGTCTFKESLVAILASHVGLLAGGGTATITIEQQDDTTDAVVMTVDANGNRSAVTIADC